MKLLMISGKSAADTALGEKNAFYNTLDELHKYFERIDVEAKGMTNDELRITKPNYQLLITS